VTSPRLPPRPLQCGEGFLGKIFAYNSLLHIGEGPGMRSESYDIHIMSGEQQVKYILLRIPAFILVLCSVAWFARTLQWDSFITFLGAIGAYLGTEYALYKKGPSQDNEHDIALFEEFQKALPFEDSIRFLQQTDMAGSFRSSDVEHIRQFHATWDNADYEFKDRVIEKARMRVYRAIDDFINYSAENILRHHNFLLRVPKEWKEEKPDKYNKVVDTLNDMADEIVDSHQELIRIVKKKLF